MALTWEVHGVAEVIVNGLAANDVTLDDAAIEELTNSPYDLVGQLTLELAERAAVVARAVVRVRRDRTWSVRSDARPPGYTKALIRPALGYDAQGLLYGAVLAPYDPGFFLEYPREDREQYPFLSTGLDSLAL